VLHDAVSMYLFFLHLTNLMLKREIEMTDYLSIRNMLKENFISLLANV
jgi:hypothetical protein